MPALLRAARTTALSLALLATASAPALAQPQPVAPKGATEATRAANQAVQLALPFDDRDDFERASRGLIARPDTLTIRDASGKVVWDMEAYKAFITPDAAAPDTVNPSLWRNAQLNMNYGLFRVTDRIFQVRGYDLSNITFVQGDTGWIVLDPLISTETAKAAFELVTRNLGARPIVAVIYSHSHGDHYGGARGIVDEADVTAGRIKIIAPEHFLEHAVSENVIAGNPMNRRGVYMYGPLLPRNAQGGVNAGLGQTSSAGTVSLIPPTDEIKATGEELAIDGVRMVFQMTPGTEAPAEMNTYFPQFKAMWLAENATGTMHNILTLRGALVRDALQWAKFLDETIRLYGGDIDVKFQAHHWPVWGHAEVLDYLEKQRDLYKYLHDQSVNLMNKGLTGEEIAEEIALPPELDREWYNRGYYGTLRHNSRAVYQRYMGWYDGNPSDLDNLPPVAAARKYVEYMGGEDAVLARARADFDKGEYRWVAEALKHVVFANPESVAGKSLLADTYEQLGYQAESGPWRAIYLTGATELRNGVPTAGGTSSASPDTIKAMPPGMLFDYLAVRLNGPKATGRTIGLTFDLTDRQEQYGLTVKNAVLNYAAGPLAGADATVHLTLATLNAIQLGELEVDDALASGAVRIDGDKAAFTGFLDLLDSFPFWFNIVTP